MRHRIALRYLNRNTAHRMALLKNLAEELIMFKKIRTTVAKAKSLRPFIEKIVTKAKNSPTPATLRLIRSRLLTDNAVSTLLSEIAPVFVTRQGGYTRIVKLSERPGDNAQMARIEFVDYKKTDKKAKQEAKNPARKATTDTKEETTSKRTRKPTDKKLSVSTQSDKENATKE